MASLPSAGICSYRSSCKQLISANFYEGDDPKPSNTTVIRKINITKECCVIFRHLLQERCQIMIDLSRNRNNTDEIEYYLPRYDSEQS